MLVEPKAPPKSKISAAAGATCVAKLTLPAYARDGRPLQWNASRTAVAFDASDDEYRSDPTAVNASTLKLLARSPAHMASAMQRPRKELPSQRLGTAIHAATLEPALFASKYLRYSRSRCACSKADYQARNPGRVIVSDKEWETADNVSRALLAKVIVRNGDEQFTLKDLRNYGQCERVIYWLDEETGLTCKARLDLMAGPVTLDIKSTDDARQAAFKRQCAQLRYDIQAAFYLRARRALEPEMQGHVFIMLAVETEAPYASVAHKAAADRFIKPGDREVSRLLKQFKACRDSFDYPAYDEPAADLELPMNMLYALGYDDE